MSWIIKATMQLHTGHQQRLDAMLGIVDHTNVQEHHTREMSGTTPK